MPWASWRGYLPLSLVSCPIYLSPAWLVLRPLLRWPDRQQAALAFDHDIAGIGCGRRDQRDLD